MRTITLSLTVAAAVAVAALLGSCTGPGTQSPDSRSSVEVTPEAPAEPVVVGLVPAVEDCWQQADYASATTWGWWAGSDPVDCSAPHNSVTVLVESLDEGIVYPASLTAEANAPRLSEDPAWVAAMAAAENTYTAQVASTAYTRASLTYYLPAPEQWAAGQRWLRVDLLVHDYGLASAYTAIELPGRSVVEDALRGADYDLCLNTANDPLTVGPLADDQAVSVDCASHPQWMVMPRFALAGSDGPFPGADAVEQDVQQSCTSIRGTLRAAYWYGYSTTEEKWNQGERQGACWVSTEWRP